MTMPSNDVPGLEVVKSRMTVLPEDLESDPVTPPAPPKATTPPPAAVKTAPPSRKSGPGMPPPPPSWGVTDKESGVIAVPALPTPADTSDPVGTPLAPPEDPFTARMEWHTPLDPVENIKITTYIKHASVKEHHALPPMCPALMPGKDPGAPAIITASVRVPAVYPPSRDAMWPRKGVKYEELAGLPFDTAQMDHVIKQVKDKKIVLSGVPHYAALGGVSQGVTPADVDRVDYMRYAWAAYTGEIFREATGDEAPINPTESSPYNFQTNRPKDTTGMAPDETISDSDAERALVEALADIANFTKVDDESTPLDPVGTSAKPSVAAPVDYSRPVTRPNGTKYLPRKVKTGGLSTREHVFYDVELVKKAYDSNLPILLLGEPGTGKTSLAEAALSNLVTINGTAETEVADLIGSHVQHGDSFLWVDGPLLTAMRNGWPILIDEIALIEPRVIATAYPLMDGRNELVVTSNPEIGVVKAEPGFYIIGACNPNVPGAIMSDALLSRFTLQIEVTTDYDLLLNLGVDQEIITVARNLARQVTDTNAISRAPQTRELLDFQRVKNLFGLTMALSNLLASAEEQDREAYARLVNSTYSTKVNSLKL